MLCQRCYRCFDFATNRFDAIKQVGNVRVSYGHHTTPRLPVVAIQLCPGMSMTMHTGTTSVGTYDSLHNLQTHLSWHSDQDQDWYGGIKNDPAALDRIEHDAPRWAARH